MKGKGILNYNKLILVALPLIVFTLLSVSSIPVVMASHNSTVKLEDDLDRIVKTGQTGDTLTMIVNSTANSLHKITRIGIGNGTRYQITAATATGWTCSVDLLATNCTNTTAAGAISSGSSVTFTLTVNTPASGNTGSVQWHVLTNDSESHTYGNYLYLLAVDTADIAFDLRDELDNYLNGTTVPDEEKGSSSVGYYEFNVDKDLEGIWFYPVFFLNNSEESNVFYSYISLANKYSLQDYNQKITKENYDKIFLLITIFSISIFSTLVAMNNLKQLLHKDKNVKDELEAEAKKGG